MDSGVDYCITFAIGLGLRIGSHVCEGIADRGLYFQQGVHTGLIAEAKGC